jgi:NADH dehydrogenase
MLVYVTGASGFVGRHVVEALRDRGAEVRMNRVDLLDGPGLERAMGGCDAVVHVAALYEASESTLRRVNVDGTRAVLKAAERAGVRRIAHTSTATRAGPSRAGAPRRETRCRRGRSPSHI